MLKGVALRKYGTPAEPIDEAEYDFVSIEYSKGIARIYVREDDQIEINVDGTFKIVPVTANDLIIELL